MIEAGAKPMAEYMRESLGIPYCYAPHSYGQGKITQNYCRMEAFLDVKFSIAAYREEAEKFIGFYCRQLCGISLAVGEAANADPFELARALVDYGFNVPYIFSDRIGNSEQEDIAWLAAQRPETNVFVDLHPGMDNFTEQKLRVDPTPVLSIGAERINGDRGKKIGGNLRWNDIIDTKTC